MQAVRGPSPSSQARDDTLGVWRAHSRRDPLVRCRAVPTPRAVVRRQDQAHFRADAAAEEEAHLDLKEGNSNPFSVAESEGSSAAGPNSHAESDAKPKRIAFEEEDIAVAVASTVTIAEPG